MPTDKVLVRIQIKKTEVLTSVDQTIDTAGVMTRWGWVLKVGDNCTKFTKEDVGKLVRISDQVELSPMVDVSNTNVPKYIPNPNSRLFSFKDLSDTNEAKHFKKMPTALLQEWGDIEAVYEE